MCCKHTHYHHHHIYQLHHWSIIHITEKLMVIRHAVLWPDHDMSCCSDWMRNDIIVLCDWSRLFSAQCHDCAGCYGFSHSHEIYSSILYIIYNLS
jgi:hypothetical protein